MKYIVAVLIALTCVSIDASGQTSPDELKFVRQGVRRIIFDEGQSIPLASINPGKIVGISAMHPVKHYSKDSMLILTRYQKITLEKKGNLQIVKSSTICSVI